jgi:glycosyltransferase involved in cell wall biosynthesis/GT2 family glycosyltransferase
LAKILISSKDLQGPIRNGGVGAAFTEYAKLLASQGHHVECLLSCEAQFIESPGLDHWKRVYASFGVQLTLLDDAIPSAVTKAHLFHAPELEKSYRVSLFAQQRCPEILIMGDYGGDAYFPFTAADRTYKTVIVIHGTSFWGKVLNSEYIDDKRDLTAYDIELACINNADVVIHPSQYIMDWHRPYLDKPKGMEMAICNPIRVDASKNTANTYLDNPIKTFAFVGRLEHRKGIDIFLAAASEMTKLHPDAKFKLYGKGGVIDGMSAFEYIERKVPSIFHALEINTDLGTAEVFERLKKDNAILVFSSRADNCPMTILEAAAHKVPALIARCTGQVELVNKKYIDRYGFFPSAGDLLQRMQEVFGKIVSPVETSAFVKNAKRDILNLTTQLAAKPGFSRKAEATSPRKNPCVSVCIPSMGKRMANLEKIVEELKSPYIKEIIIVNDGGNQELLSNFAKTRKNCKFLNQPNRYPGAARNYAAKEARGEFLLFLDDDNRPQPRMLEKYVETLIEHGYDCVSSWFFVGSGNGPRKIQTMPGLAGISDVFENKIADNNFLIRRNVFQNIGGYKETWGVGYEDFFFLRQLIDKGHSLHVIPEPLFFYEQSNTGVNNGSNMLAATLETMLIDVSRTTRVYAAALASAWVKRSRRPSKGIPASLNQYLSTDATSPEALFLSLSNVRHKRSSPEFTRAFDKFALRLAASRASGKSTNLLGKFAPTNIDRLLSGDEYVGSFVSLLILYEDLVAGRPSKLGLRKLDAENVNTGQVLINQLANALAVGAYIDAAMKLKQVVEHYSGIYIQENQDVVPGVKSGYFKSGWDHYVKVAHSEPWRHFQASGHVLLAQSIIARVAKGEAAAAKLRTTADKPAFA